MSMGMTMTQKILAKHAGLESVRAGQLIMAKLLNVPISEVWNMVRIENTSISTMKVHDNGDVEIVRWGDDSHLPEELKTGYVRIAGFVQKKYNADYDVIKVEGSHNFPPFAL